jgi:hypothetical protein
VTSFHPNTILEYSHYLQRRGGKSVTVEVPPGCSVSVLSPISGRTRPSITSESLVTTRFLAKNRARFRLEQSYAKNGLEAEHYAVDVSADGEQARAMAGELDFNLVVSIESMDGVAILRFCAPANPACQPWY